MENQKIINLLNKADIDSKHFATNQICVMMQKRIFWLMVLL